MLLILLSETLFNTATFQNTEDQNVQSKKKKKSKGEVSNLGYYSTRNVLRYIGHLVLLKW